MCFIRVNTKHQPIKPPGAAPTLTNVYDKNILETSIDVRNPTSNEIIASLDVNEKLQVNNAENAHSQPVRKVSVEEVTKKHIGKSRESMPKDRRGSRGSKSNKEKDKIGSKAVMGDHEAERQRSLGILKNIQGG